MSFKFAQDTADAQPNTPDAQPNAADAHQLETPQRKAWDRLEDQGETPLAYSRFVEYLHLGPKRTLLGLHRAELAKKAALAGESPKKPDSTPSSLRELAKRFDWEKRANKFTLAEVAEEQAGYAATLRERRRMVLEQEWEHGQQMVEVASEALSHGQKFFTRTSKLVRGQVVETEEYDAKTGKTVIVRERVDREIVHLDIKAGEISRMLMEGSKLTRMSVGMTSEKAQEECMAEPVEPEEDFEATDRELFEMFEMLGANNYRPKPQPAEDEAAEDEVDEEDD